jgi:hypothetical protein
MDCRKSNDWRIVNQRESALYLMRRCANHAEFDVEWIYRRARTDAPLEDDYSENSNPYMVPDGEFNR